MHTEMNNLKTIATDGVSKLRTRERTLLDERQRDRDAMAEMEKKLENANQLIRLLRSSGSRYYDAQGATADIASSLNSLPPSSINRLTTPQRHRQGASPLCEAERHHTTPLSGGGVSRSERKFAAELSTEKELRYKAEEICAGVLANSKVALEERDMEISRLKSQLFNFSNERYN